MRCPSCNTPNGEAEATCRHCGAALFGEEELAWEEAAGAVAYYERTGRLPEALSTRALAVMVRDDEDEPRVGCEGSCLSPARQGG